LQNEILQILKNIIVENVILNLFQNPLFIKDTVIPACPESFFSSSFENKEDSGQAGMTIFFFEISIK
jgi:hypothetical protein